MFLKLSGLSAPVNYISREFEIKTKKAPALARRGRVFPRGVGEGKEAQPSRPTIWIGWAMLK
jgi:hypothetical protein